jgi:hypothetical protein
MSSGLNLNLALDYVAKDVYAYRKNTQAGSKSMGQGN